MLSDERLAEIRAAVEGSRAVHNRPWIAELLAAYDEQRAEIERLRAQVADYENGINWGVSCINCAHMLDQCYAETVRAEKAEAQVAAVETVCMKWVEPNPMSMYKAALVGEIRAALNADGGSDD